MAAAFGGGEGPESYGPTAVNAQSANGGLAAGVARDGTVTVFRWPRPSFHDHVSYTTQHRDMPNWGTPENSGTFFGLRVATDDGERTTWLRDWDHEQAYADEWSDAVETTFRHDELGLSATVTDVVAPDRDLLSREVTVERDDDSPVESATLYAFANWSLVVSKRPHLPLQDWAFEGLNAHRAAYDDEAGAVVHRKSGTDRSTGEESAVALATGFREATDSVHVGGDAHLPGADPRARHPGPSLDAYEAADAGDLPGATEYEGHATAVETRELDFEDGEASATWLVAAAGTPGGATHLLGVARECDPAARRQSKRDWIAGLLDDPPLPATDDEALRALCRRALVTLVTNYDRESGALVASIATQSPYGEDWVRDGAFFNHALGVLGRHDWVRTRNLWYADLQQGPDDGVGGPQSVPPGNWAMNYYADGVPAGPIPWEIDETAYGVWTFVDHYRATGDEAYLREVYPNLCLAADFLADCRDPETGLQSVAIEDDNPQPRQTIMGAATVWLALDAAAEAAAELGEEADAARYRERRDELADAIDDNLWDDERDRYGAREREVDWKVDPHSVYAEVGWPVRFADPDDDRMAAHLDALWEADLARSFAEPGGGERDSGLYEPKGLLTLAKAWRGDEERMERVREGLDWVAREFATDDTYVMGETWMVRDGEVVTTVSQPHAWEQVLTYLAALEAYPPDGVDPEPGWGGVLAALRGHD